MTCVNSIDRVRLENFTVFRSVDINLAEGLNVFIGENGTGKSHLLKVLYASLRPFRDAASVRVSGKEALGASIGEALDVVFRPDSVGRLVSRQRGGATSTVRVTLGTEAGPRALGYSFTRRSRDRVTVAGTFRPFSVSSTFLPTREVMSFFPGFAHAWERRELEFDATHYDLCRALSGAPLKRGVRKERVSALVDGLEEQLDARVRIDNGRFYVRSADGDIEAHLVAEGLRKLATVMYLILNGTLGESSIVFWDEPEANLNPRYVDVVSSVLIGLARAGVQVHLATHDYLLTQKLSLAVETHPDAPQVAFHSLRREEDGGLTSETAATLSMLEHNPILAEFARHYDEELDAVAATSHPEHDAGLGA